MSGRRKEHLVDCNPRWGSDSGENDCWITFDCPEGHEGCRHTISFTPALDGTEIPDPGHARWERKGDTFETLTLTPSIRRISRHASREAAIAADCVPEYVTESLLCAMHVELEQGIFKFAGDSR